jgi:hypothetical protein
MQFSAAACQAHSVKNGGRPERPVALDGVRPAAYCPSFRMPHILAHPISPVVAVVDRAAARKRLR